MDLTIRIEDPNIEKKILEGVDGLPKEVIADIILEAFKTYLEKHPDIIEKTLFKEKRYYDSAREPADWVLNIFNNYKSDKIQDYRDKIIEYLAANPEELIFKALIKSITNELRDKSFEISIYETLNRIDGDISNIKSRIGMSN